MRKIIIMGHPDSHYQDVEKIFQMHGMAPALPSKREQMTPIEIGRVLHKVQVKAPTTEQVPTRLTSQPTTRKAKKNKKHPKSNSKQQMYQTLVNASLANMWDALPMDLMLANIDQDFWGWSDPQAIELLDYWANLDPSIHFVFIYDKPQNIFQHRSLEEALDLLDLDENKIQEKLDSWQQYNEKVLQSFNKYKQRSVLISSQRIQETVLQSTSEIYKQIDVPVQVLDSLKKEQQEIEEAQTDDTNSLSQECALSSLIVDNIMQDNPQALSLYEELQDQANFPYVTPLLPNSGSLRALSAWKEMIHQQIEIDKQIKKSQQIQSEKEDLTALLNQQVQDLQNFEKELQDSQQKGCSLEKQNIDLSKQKKELETKNIELKNQASELEKQTKQAKDEIKNTQDKLLTLEDENKALMAQLNFTQEELERLFLANQKLTEKPLLWGAADRVRNQLTYRIGYKLQQHGKSPLGWMKLPFILYSTYRQYSEDKKKNEWHKLPPIHLYQDVYEAEKVKKHLSYKLGEIFMKDIKNPLKWLLILSKLIKEGKKFKVDNKG